MNFRAFLTLLGISIGISALGADAPSGFVTSWLTAQTKIQTWTAEVTQTRRLKALTQPLVSHGRLWFSAPDRFRWELGQPAQTIAIRTPQEMVILYPRPKRAERYPMTGDAVGPWKDMLALLDAGFPRNLAELESRFRIVAETVAAESVAITLQPRNPAARRFMPEIRLVVGKKDYALLATELQFADGSVVRSDFSASQTNLELKESLFVPEIGPDYKISTAMGSR